MAPLRHKPAIKTPHVCDLVVPVWSDSNYRIIRVSPNGAKVDIILEGGSLKRLRVPLEELTFTE